MEEAPAERVTVCPVLREPPAASRKPFVRAGRPRRLLPLPRPPLLFLFPLALAPLFPQEARGQVEGLVKTYVDAVRKVNEEHARTPGKTREDSLARRMPKPARAALDKLLKSGTGPAVLDGLVTCGEAALDLDLIKDFVRIRKLLEGASPTHAGRLGIALSRERFLLRGLGGLSQEYLEGFAEVLEAVLSAYDEVFGFEEWSKVPRKKLRVRIHLEEKITQPPHFAPQFPFHSEIDFPVVDPKSLDSPTPDGKFLFYGLCHELGHVVAMWGNPKLEEDQHAWAHYTGVAIVERLSEIAKDRPFMQKLRDVRWRSLSEERKRLSGRAPSCSDRDGVLALLIALHDKVGPKAIGIALNRIDREDRRLRVNGVRYYSFAELREALLSTLKSADSKKAVASLIPAAKA